MGARNLAPPDKLPSIWYGASSLLARSVPAPRHREAVQFWTKGVELAEARGEEMVASMLLREMATHTAKFGDVSCGLDYAREAKVRALRSGLPVYIRDADTVLAATLLQAGKFSEAMRVMPDAPTSLEQEDHPIGLSVVFFIGRDSAAAVATNMPPQSTLRWPMQLWIGFTYLR